MTWTGSSVPRTNATIKRGKNWPTRLGPRVLTGRTTPGSEGVPLESLEVVLEKAPHQYTQEEKAALAEHKNEMYRQLLANMSPADLSHEVKDTLDALRAKGLLLAIGSSSKNAPFILDRSGWGIILTRSRWEQHFPLQAPPEVFLLAAEYLGLAPADCLVVEDAVSGVDAGIAGGFDTAAIGYASTYHKATYHLKTFSDLLTIVEG